MNESQALAVQFQKFLLKWNEKGKQSHLAYKEAAESIIAWKRENRIKSVFNSPPSIVTATIDDSFGMGISVINLFSEALGLNVHFLGLYKTTGDILEACIRLNPSYLGLTVLQADTEEDIAFLSENLPSTVKIISGGPVYKMDPGFAQRAGVHFVAGNADAFIRFMLAQAGLAS